jgi:hypothetical protein
LCRSSGRVADIHDPETEPLVDLGAEEQARGVHRVGEGHVEREVVRPRLGLVGHEHQERLVGTFLEFQLRHGRPQSLDVSAEGIDQQILAGAVETLVLGCGRPCLEGIPGQAMDLLVAGALVVHHQDGDVIPGGGDVRVSEEAVRPRPDVAADGVDQLLARGDVSADAAHIGLDDAERRIHGDSRFFSGWCD